MAESWSALEDAIWQWVQLGSGLAPERVIWSDQDANAPARDFITIRIGTLVAVGLVDGVHQSFDASRPAGQEIELATEGPREFTVSVQAFSSQVIGPRSALALIDKVQTALRLPTRRAALNAAGIGVLTQGRVQNLSTLRGADYESRAVLEVRCLTMQTATERTGYISSLEIQNVTTGERHVVDSSKE